MKDIGRLIGSASHQHGRGDGRCEIEEGARAEARKILDLTRLINNVSMLDRNIPLCDVACCIDIESIIHCTFCRLSRSRYSLQRANNIIIDKR